MMSEEPRIFLELIAVATQSFPIYLNAMVRHALKVQFSSVAQLCLIFATPQNAARQAFLSITNSWDLLKLMYIELVMPSNHLIFCHSLLRLPSIFPSIGVFLNESVFHIRWPKYWSFSFSPSNEYSGLISCTMDWLDLLAVQGSLKSHLQHHSSKASILRCSAFFVVQLTSIHDHWKNHSLDQMDLCCKATCLLFNMLLGWS